MPRSKLTRAKHALIKSNHLTLNLDNDCIGPPRTMSLRSQSIRDCNVSGFTAGGDLYILLMAIWSPVADLGTPRRKVVHRIDP